MAGPDRQDLYLGLRGFLASPAGSWVAFVWGFLEATVFFVIPDLYLGFAALFFPRYGLLFCFWSVAGALLGGAGMYFLGQCYPQVMLKLLDLVPGISAKMIAAVQSEVAAQGIPAMLTAPWEGVPYKIYAVVMGAGGAHFGYFMLATVPARLERFILSLVIALALGWVCRAHIARQARGWLWGYGLVWGLIYAQYAYTVHQRWGG